MEAGNNPLLAIANQNGFTETFSAKSQYLFTLDVLPDLMVSPYYLWTTPLTQTNITITTTVYNIGAVPATNVTVGYYKNGSLDDSDLVMTQTISLLEPASSIQLIVQVPGPLTCGLTVWVDPKLLINETTKANNLASVIPPGNICLSGSIYLPIVRR